MVNFLSILSFFVVTNTAGVYCATTSSYLNWKTFNANGANLGGWLVQESTIDTTWWAQNSGGAPDEWGLCVHLGSQCGPVLERRYATWITTSDIDTLAAAGINTLRIPTSYAAWIKVPGSQLYTGNQVSFLNNIATYAINKYGMHIIIDIHSLPGGVNGMPFGEAEGHYGWFNNATALDYSLQTVDAVISYVKNSQFPQSFTIAPINEPVDVPDITLFGSPYCLTESGAQWVGSYIHQVIAKVQAVNAQIPVMFQGSFKGEEYWSPNFTTDTNLVFDVHNYYFAGRGASSANLTQYICQDAVSAPGDGKFPVFIGEWSIQAEIANTFSSRKKNLQTGIAAWKKYTRGSSYWTSKFFGNATVDGEGTQADYWNLESFISLGYTGSSTSAVVC
ncbi:glycoside hydrolase superfamily [Penicillium nucicola]|uniref:glycoside hydrolase superfamily n=1 Tax=Penicillium nucicola TaxID=1850975 RepID=UPI002545805E|nr:glycoside hydrolase superfamily [Penicillium nucicola]KAJ5753767.1 glycoside hydrolase superfamily [Penicillium nucicola]